MHKTEEIIYNVIAFVIIFYCAMFYDVHRDRILTLTLKNYYPSCIFLNRLDKGNVFVHMNSSSYHFSQRLNTKN